MVSKSDKKCKIAGCTEPFTEKELCRLKLALLHTPVSKEKHWKCIAKLLGDKRPPDDYKNAAIMKLNLMPPNYGQTKKNLDTKRAKSKKDAKSGRKQTKTKNSSGTRKKTDQWNDKQEASISSSSLDSGSSSDKDLMMDSDDSFWDAIAPILEAPKKEETKPRLRNPRKTASARSNEAVDRENSPMQVMSSPIRQRYDRFNAVVLKSFKGKRRRSLSDSEVTKSSNNLQRPVSMSQITDAVKMAEKVESLRRKFERERQMEIYGMDGIEEGDEEFDNDNDENNEDGFLDGI